MGFPMQAKHLLGLLDSWISSHNKDCNIGCLLAYSLYSMSALLSVLNSFDKNWGAIDFGLALNYSRWNTFSGVFKEDLFYFSK